MGYNTQVHATTGTSPYKVFYGRDPFSNVALDPGMLEHVREMVRLNSRASAITTLKRQIPLSSGDSKIDPGRLYVI